MARPLKVAGEKFQSLPLRAPRSFVARLDEFARRRGLSRSEALRLAAEAGFDARGPSGGHRPEDGSQDAPEAPAPRLGGAEVVSLVDRIATLEAAINSMATVAGGDPAPGAAALLTSPAWEAKCRAVLAIQITGGGEVETQ